MLLLSAQT